jgi:hypothetical protein
MKLNSKKFLAPVLALFFVLGVMVSGAVAAQPSGAASFVAYFDATQVAVGGDPVNVSINVLDEDGAVNLISSGQHGDVCFFATSQIGTAYAANFQAVNPGNPFVPANGICRHNIRYNGVSGTDTVMIGMYEAIDDGSGTGGIIAGNLIKSQKYNITVAPGTASVSRITSVYAGNGDGAGNAAGNATDTNVGQGGTTTLQWVNGRYTQTGATNIYSVAAGINFPLHVRTPLSQSGTVKVAICKVADFMYAGAATPTIIKRYLPVAVQNTIDMNVSLGVGDTVTSIEKSGYYLLVAYIERADGSIAEVPMANAAGNVQLLRVTPDVPAALSLSSPVSYVQKNAASAADILVRLVDKFGNLTADAANPVTVKFSGATIVDLAIAALNTQGRATAITAPNTPSFLLTASAGALSSLAALPFVTLADAQIKANGGALALNDFAVGVDGAPGTRTITSGQKVTLGINLAGPNLLAVGDSLTMTIGSETASGTVAADVAGWGKAEFTFKSAAAAGSGFVLTAKKANGTVLSPVSVYTPNLVAWVNLGSTSPWAAAVNFTGIQVNPGPTASIKHLGFRGTEVMKYNLGGGNALTLYGQEFQCLDASGNNVPPSNLGPQIWTSESTQFKTTMTPTGVVAEWTPNGFAANAFDQNIGLGYASNANGSNESVTFTYGAKDVGNDDLTLYNTVIPLTSHKIELFNIGGAAYSIIKLSGDMGTTTSVEMPQNGTMTLIVETLNAAGARAASAANTLMLNIDNGNVQVQWLKPAAVVTNLVNGALFDTATANQRAGIAGRAVLQINALSGTGKTTIGISQTTGSAVSNNLVVDVKAIAPDPPDPTNSVGLNAGMNAGTYATDQELNLFLNITNSKGDAYTDIKQAWFMVGLTLNGEFYLYFWDGAVLTPWDDGYWKPGAVTYDFTYPPVGAAAFEWWPGFTLDTLGVPSGEAAWYGYAYSKSELYNLLEQFDQVVFENSNSIIAE